MQNNLLKHFYNNDTDFLELGIDEAGRGPMFGRVYSACVILPKSDNFNYSLLKDSKKFSSKKKINEVANYIKNNALTYSICYEDEKMIDKINIRQSTHKAMHNCINNICKQFDYNDYNNKLYLLVDGNDFKNYTYFNNTKNCIEQINHVLIEGGDNKYCSIAAASILAKVERDNYIEEICNKYTKLDFYYQIKKNKGYGTAKHLEGIKQYGISPWHRKTYGCCKESQINNEEYYLETS